MSYGSGTLGGQSLGSTAGESTVQISDLEIVTVDDFEDGDIQGWTGDTSNFEAQNNTVINGSFTGKIDASTETNTVSKNGFTAETIKFTVRPEEDLNSLADDRIYKAEQILKESGNTVGTFIIETDTSVSTPYSEMRWDDGNTVTTLRTYSRNTNYKVEIQKVDADNVKILVDSTDEGTFSTAKSFTTIEKISLSLTDDSVTSLL